MSPNHFHRRQRLLDRIKGAVYKSDPLAEVYLFGSRATGSHREDSDWDLLVLVDAPSITNEIEDKFRDRLYDIELESGHIISTLIYPKDYWKSALRFSPLYANVSRDGIKL